MFNVTQQENTLIIKILPLCNQWYIDERSFYTFQLKLIAEAIPVMRMTFVLKLKTVNEDNFQ